MRQCVLKGGHHRNQIQVQRDGRDPDDISADLKKIERAAGRIADPDIHQQKRDQEDEQDPGDRRLFEVCPEPRPELLERIDDPVVLQRPEHNMIEGAESCPDGKKRDAQQHEQDIGGNDDAEPGHKSAEETVVV